MKKLTTVRLAAATYFLVAGGPYGLEELIGAEGYTYAAVIVLFTPLLFSLPTALMVGELASAIPEDGGYYVWVKRALGPRWGFVEAWLSLCASFFDMAIYPTIFTTYLGMLVPALGDGAPKIAVGIGLVAGCTLWNLRGARSVGSVSVFFTVLLLAPFVVLSAFAFASATPAPAASVTPAAPIGGGLLVAMWNYMGWDNASTVAGEVERPQRTYPRAMALAVGAVMITYLVPVVAASRTSMELADWSTGGWVTSARHVGGAPLAVAVALGGAVCGIGMYNALLLSYSRVPAALAEDGLLPKAFGRTNARGVPVTSVLVCSAFYCVGLLFSFRRLIEIDLLFYGVALLLEFVALAVLRVREPDLPRPFRVPGRLPGAIVLGVGPAVLLVVGFAKELANGESHRASLIAGITALVVGVVVWARRRPRP